MHLLLGKDSRERVREMKIAFDSDAEYKGFKSGFWIRLPINTMADIVHPFPNLRHSFADSPLQPKTR